MLVDRAKAFFDRIFPGFTARLERIAGGYRPAPPYRVVPPARDRPQVIQLWLHYLAKARRGIHITIRIIAERHPDEWKIVEHCYHFGPNPMSDSDDDSTTYFRVCRNDSWPYHFHQRGLERAYDKGHIPAESAEPPLLTDPHWFLGLVETFIETNAIPIKVKP